MKAILLLLCFGFFSGLAAAQYSTDTTTAPATPVIISPGQSPASSGLQELSPPTRAGRRGGVYVTGAPPMPPANDFANRIANAITNALRTNDVGASGPATVTNSGSGASYETEPEPAPSAIFVPTFNNPGLPGAIGGRGVPPSGSSTPSTTPNNNFLPPLTAPAGTVGPLLPPAGPAMPPPGPGATTPGNQAVTPPPPITAPPSISGPAR
jgi:hypothetical protein